MRGGSSNIARLSPVSRSRLSNGSALHVDAVDGRTREARRFRDLLAEIVNDLGGPDGLSEGQRQLARRCAMISVECERLEARAVAGEPFDAEFYGTLCDRLGRAFARIGLKRSANAASVAPSLSDYLKSKAVAA